MSGSLEFGLYTDGRHTYIEDGRGAYLDCTCRSGNLPSVLTELPRGCKFIMTISPDMVFPENPMLTRDASGNNSESIGEIVGDLNNG